MIRIVNQPLPDQIQRQLFKYQQAIDIIANYAQRVAQAKEQFKNKNKKENATFRVIRQALSDLCAGNRRCMFCEDSCADEIEHFRPKDIYPEFTFVWENYLYACGFCNGPKSNQFEVFDAITLVPVSVSRTKNDPVIPPISGDPVLLDLRKENPMEYLALDLRETFYFQQHPLLVSERDKVRATATIKILDLNRDVLVKARRSAYGNYQARLREYVEDKKLGKPDSHLNLLIGALRHLPHPTVWREMQRQYSRIEPLTWLFEQAPEALHW